MKNLFQIMGRITTVGRKVRPTLEASNSACGSGFMPESVGLGFALFCGLSALTAAGQDSTIDLGDRRELFVDHALIASMDNVELRLQEPQREDIAIRFDEPWEGPFSAYATVLNDHGLFRMYYAACRRRKRAGWRSRLTRSPGTG